MAHIKMGMSLAEIEKRLGPNPEWQVRISRKDKRAALIKFDQTEFYLGPEEEQKLYGIQITYSKPADAKGLQMDYRELVRPLSRLKLKNFLHAQQIPFQETVSPYDARELLLSLETGIQFFFDEEEILQKFGRFL